MQQHVYADIADANIYMTKLFQNISTIIKFQMELVPYLNRNQNYMI